MSTRYESRNYYVESPRREVSASRKKVYYDYYEGSRARRRQPSFIQRSNSVKNERALVLFDRTRNRPTRTFSSDMRQDSWALDVDKAGGYRTVSPTTYGSGAIERRQRSPSPVRSCEREREREPPAQVIINNRVFEERDLDRRNRSRSRPPAPVIMNNRIYEEREDSLVRDGASMKGVQVVLGPESDRDTTIHLELDIEGDVESQLEEFSHLKRLGNFHAAEQYFQTNLHEYLDVPPVAVEYAEMLLQQGAYQRLTDLLQKQELNAPVPPRSWASSPRLAPVTVAGPVTRGKDHEIEERHVPPRPQPIDVVDEPSYVIRRIYQAGKIKSDAEKFDLAFRLIEATAQMHSQGWLRRALSEADDAEQEFYMHRRRKCRLEDSSLSSTEVQLINYWHDIQSHVSSRSNFVYLELARRESLWSDWSGLHDSLREECRIWELGDVISSSLAAFGGTKTWANLFSEDLYAANFLEELLDDWGVNQEYDESTYLAILAILVDLCQGLLSLSGPFFDRDAVVTAKRCLEHARRFATCIKENDPPNVKSRPYISWIIVQKGLERNLTNTAPGISSNKPGFYSQYLHSLPGLTVGTSILPIYVPIKSEIPGWPVSEQPAKTDELLQHALKASQELGDYNAEVACLREMICRSPQPKKLFERLAHVQKTLQGDMVGYLETLLSKYLLVTDEESRQSLNDELSAFDAHQPISYDIRDPLIQWCQRMVQAALFRSPGRYPAETEHVEQMAQDLLVSLPNDIYEKALNLGFQGSVSIPRIPSYPGKAQARYASPPPPPSPTRGAEFERWRPDYERERKRERARNEVTIDVTADYQLAKAQELEAYKLEKEREKEEKRIKEELELQRLREEKREMELKIIKEEVKKAIEKYKFEEAEKKAVQEEEERKYQARLEADLQKAGLDARQIAVIQGKAPIPNTRLSYTRMARRHLSLETLNRYRLDYEIDQDPDYVLIKRWVPEYEQDFLWNHTKTIRSKRGGAQTVGPDDGTEVPTDQNIEAHRRTISPPKEVHQTPESSSEDAIARMSWPQVNEEAEKADISQFLSPRVVDSKLHSGDVNDSNTHDYNLPREYDTYSPSPPHASSGSYYPQNNEFPPPPANPSFLKDTKGKGKEDETQADEDSTNGEVNEDDAASKSSDEVIVIEEHSPSRKLKKNKIRPPGPKDLVVLKEQSPPPNLQGLQMQISRRPEGGNKVVVTEHSPSPKLKKSKIRSLVKARKDVLDETVVLDKNIS